MYRKIIFLGAILTFFIAGVNKNFANANKPDIIKQIDNKTIAWRLVMEEGKTYYLELENLVDGVIEYKVVDKLESPHKTIVARFEHAIMFGTIFTIVNPFQKKLDCRLSAGQIPLFVGTYQKKWQGRFYSSMVLSNLELTSLDFNLMIK